MTDARHTPAADFLASQGNDMFAGAPLDGTPAHAYPPHGDLLTFEGILVRAAELRTTTAADGLHSQPIVCLELRPLDKRDRRTCQAQIPFTDATRHAAELCARHHKKGMVVKVSSHTLDVRMTLPQAQIINSYTPS
jgi:hypothetical protein